jgi:hypothetical protein
MSEININRVDFCAGEERDWPIELPDLTRENLLVSLRDGEELMAAYKFLEALDRLGNGQALVVWRDLF